MDASEIETLDRLESIHWWYESRRRLLSNWTLSLIPACDILDLGSASGGNTKVLLDLGFQVTSLEFSQVGVDLQKAKGIKVIKGDARNTGLRSSTFDAVICLDVLEHIEEDFQVILEILRVSKPGAKFLFSVPEDPTLWSSHDEAVSHVRRYTREQFQKLLMENGLSIVDVWSTNIFIKPLVRIARHFTSGSNLGPVPVPINWMLLQVSELEHFFNLKKRSGITLWATGEARK